MKKNKILLALSIILLSSTISAGCMMMGGGMDMDKGSKGGMDMGDSKKAPKAKVSMSKCGADKATDKSYIIAQRYCSQCHVMRVSDEFTSKEWKPILGRMMRYMQKQAKLKPDAYEKVMIEHYYEIE